VLEYLELADGKSIKKEDQAKYECFVAHFLWAAEEILEYAPKEWETNLRLYMKVPLGIS
jgi:hypothetical protein